MSAPYLNLLTHTVSPSFGIISSVLNIQAMWESITSISDFINRAEPLLKQHPAANNLLIGVSYLNQKAKKPVPFHGFITKYESPAFALQVATRSLILSYPFTTEQAASLSEHPDLIIPKDGIVGEQKAVTKIAENLSKKWNRKFWPSMKQGVYEARSVVIPSVKGSARWATESDLDKIIEWNSKFYDECIPHDKPSSEILDEHMKSQIASRSIMVWDDGTKPVSMAVALRDIGYAAAIGGVYTPNESRRQGFGAAVTAALTHTLLESGKECISLFTDLTNPTSNSIYQSIGYRFLFESLHVRFDN